MYCSTHEMPLYPGTGASSERGEHDAAIKQLKEALDKEPPQELTDKVRVRLGDCLLRKGDIKAAVLVHHGGEDMRLVAAWPAFDAAMTKAGIVNEGHIYPGAVHGFNNDATPERYNKAAADLAWSRTVAWFNKYVRG